MTPELFASEHLITVVEAEVILSIFRPPLAAEYVVLARGLDPKKANELAASLIQRAYNHGY